MTVYELSRYELDELKSALLFGCKEVDNLDEAERAVLAGAQISSDIPDKIVYSAFSGYDFVKDDFFCNLES